MSRFSLSIACGEGRCLFPLPQSNEYQTVRDLSLPAGSERVAIDTETQAALFPHDARLTFTHEPRTLTKDFARTTFVQSTPATQGDAYINGADPDIAALAGAWVREAAAKTPADIVKALYEGTLTELSYGEPTDGLYTYRQAYERKVTDCGGFSTFLASLLEAKGMRCRLVVGYVYGYGRATRLKRLLRLPLAFADIAMHAWLEVKSIDGWFPLDASIEWRRLHGKSVRQGGFGHIPADRLVLSFGHDIAVSIHGTTHRFPILQHPEPIPTSV